MLHEDELGEIRVRLCQVKRLWLALFIAAASLALEHILLRCEEIVWIRRLLAATGDGGIRIGRSCHGISDRSIAWCRSHRLCKAGRWVDALSG